MPEISFDETTSRWALTTPATSYVLGWDGAALRHLYWGPALTRPQAGTLPQPRPARWLDGEGGNEEIAVEGGALRPRGAARPLRRRHPRTATRLLRSRGLGARAPDKPARPRVSAAGRRPLSPLRRLGRRGAQPHGAECRRPRSDRPSARRLGVLSPARARAVAALARGRRLGGREPAAAHPAAVRGDGSRQPPRPDQPPGLPVADARRRNRVAHWAHSWLDALVTDHAIDFLK
jgi:hypothetical protein